MELKSRSIEKDDSFIPILRYPAWHDTMPRYDFFFSFFSSFFENPSPLSHVEHVAFLAKCSHHPWIPARYPRQNPEASGAEKNCQTVVTSATVCRWLMAVIFLRIWMTQGSVIQSSLYINTAPLCVCTCTCTCAWWMFLLLQHPEPTQARTFYRRISADLRPSWKL